MRRLPAGLLVVLLAANCAVAQKAPFPKPDGPPVAADSRLVVELFAAAPDIVHPIATDFDAKGRLLVVESHTHFRPAKYDGPKFDRIRVLEDTDGDGKADKFTTFFEGTTATMDVAVHPDGAVYVATRNEILRVRDTDGDGKADEKTKIAGLETTGNYPHNGLSGLTFDSRGDLIFGMGENLGVPYTLTAADGSAIKGGGEGGNVFWCTADGKKPRRVATGFWNPFGAGRDIFGRLFVVDNDPDASPPCRLLHVVEGGNYGFQFRYGRSGRHPFQAWNGELPGTLPYVAGTGESPCEVISYESDGLPAEYRGDLLVPAWADHRVERYVPQAKGASVTSVRKPFVQGGKEFRPSGLAVAPDGSLFVSDWVSRSYELHGKGAVWHVRWKDAPKSERPTDPKKALLSAHRPIREPAARTLAKDEAGRAFLREQLTATDVRVRAASLTALIDAGDEKIELAATDNEPAIRALAVREMVARRSDVSHFRNPDQPAAVRAEVIAGIGGKSDPAGKELSKEVAEKDPFLQHAAVRQLARMPDVLTGSTDPRVRIGVLLAWQASGLKEATRMLDTFLADPDPDVRFLATKWVADEKLAAFRPKIIGMMKDPELDPRGFVGLSTALARIDDKPVNEDALADYFLERLRDPAAPNAIKLLALRGIPATHKNLKTEQLFDLLKHEDATFRIEALRAMKDRADAKSAPAVRDIAGEVSQPAEVRAQAIVTLSALGPADADFLIGLAGRKDAAIRDEALRSLVQVKLTDDQRTSLAAAVKGQTELLTRVLGKPAHANRPPAADTDAWLKHLEGPADPQAGRRIFEHPKLAGCYRCHRVEGRGADIGPDLSLVGRTERKWIVESILQPSAVVAPHYQAWTINKVDGRTLTGQLVHTHLDESHYVDAKGERFKLEARDMVEVTAAKGSIMPDNLVDGLTDQEVRDLVAYLRGRK